jgi:hypothetical protein
MMRAMRNPAILALLALGSALPTAAQDADLKKQAEAAKAELFTRLSGRLNAVMQSQGAEAAIQVCSTEAPVIAEAVARDKGVRIGRTSWKLRNPANQAPAWAAEPLAARPAEPWFQSPPGGGLRALLPIRLMKGCLACHGEARDLAPGVAATLARTYPQDRATGFKEGDLRGWFWVEVPEAVAP